MKFLHAADLHLDSPLVGLFGQNPMLAETLRRAGRQALVNLVDLALAERVDLLLLAGDVFDGDWKDFHTGLFFVGQMKRLADAGIPVVAIAGNHDAAGKMTKSLPLPDNVRMLAHDRPETVEFDRLGVCVHGQSFSKPAVLENLAVGYPEARPGAFNIGLLHTALDGAVGHEPYAPCRLDDLRAKGYDYWALGHIHRRGVLLERPYVAYSGNLQGRHAKETGAKGCLLAMTNAGAPPTVEFRPTEVVRWEHLEISAADADDLAEVLDRVESAAGEARQAAELPIALRLTFVGRTKLHDRLASDVHRLGFDARAKLGEESDVFLETVRVRTRPPAKTHAHEGALAEILELAREAAEEEPVKTRLREDLGDLARKLAAAGATNEAFEPPNDAWLDEILAESLPLLARKWAEADSA
jgi:DNA repair exonuclease SbcCD nuclease subunit